MEFGYEKMDVTNIAHELIQDVYRISADLPDSEKYGLKSQIQRAAISILLNIAEGSARETNKDFKRFVRIAIGSVVELDAAIKIAVKLEFLPEESYQHIEKNIKSLYFKLIGLSKYLTK